MSSRLAWGLSLLPAIVAVLLYLPTAGFEFVWDDLYFVAWNEAIRSPANIPRFFFDPATQSSFADLRGLYRPLRNVLYCIEWQAFGPWAGGYHLVSALLHALNAWLAGWVARRLVPGGRAPWAGLVAGSLMAIHPLATEAVCWVKSRDDLMVTTFALLAAGCAAGGPAGRPPSPRSIIVYTLLLWGGLLSKETGVAIPATTWLAFWLGSRLRDDWPGWRSRPALLHAGWILGAGFLMNILYLLVRRAVIGEVAQLTEPLATGAHLFWTQVRATGHGLALVAWPGTLLADYNAYHISTGPDAVALSALLLVVALGAGSLLLLRRFPALAFASGWWAVGILPVSNIIPTMQFMAERFLYLPLAGVAILAGVAVAVWPAVAGWRRNLAIGLCIAAALGMVLRTSIRIPEWANQLALFESVARDAPQNPRGLANYARALFTAGEYARCVEVLDDLEYRWPGHAARAELYDDAVHLRENGARAEGLFEVIGRNQAAVAERLQLAEIAWRSGRLETSRMLYGEVLALGENPEARAGLLIVAIRRGEAVDVRGEALRVSRVILSDLQPPPPPWDEVLRQEQRMRILRGE